MFQDLEAQITELIEANAKLKAENAELKTFICDCQILQAQADTANKAKSIFLANMSHELRSPLNIILGYGEMLRDEARAKQLDSAMELEKVCNSARHLAKVIDNIIEITRLESGEVDLYLETFDVLSLINELVLSIQPSVEKNHNSLVVYCAREVSVMHSDFNKLRQTLLYLLDNAGKFTKNGQIKITVRKEEEVSITNDVLRTHETLAFAIADSGIGMTSEQVEVIFQPFMQGDNSTTRAFEGTGLGLAIAKKLAQMMGGDISVESEWGSGSTFSLRLPAQISQPQQVQQDMGKIKNCCG
jgi:signal transduction histidine kinase